MNRQLSFFDVAFLFAVILFFLVLLFPSSDFSGFPSSHISPSSEKDLPVLNDFVMRDYLYEEMEGDSCVR